MRSRHAQARRECVRCVCGHRLGRQEARPLPWGPRARETRATSPRASAPGHPNLEVLIRHRDKPKRLEPERPAMRTLRSLVEARRFGAGPDTAHQSHHGRAEGLFTSKSRVVSRQGRNPLRGLPGALAYAAGCATRSSRNPRVVLPCGQCSLQEDHRASYRRHSQRDTSAQRRRSDHPVAAAGRGLVVPAARPVSWHRSLRRRDR